MGRGAAQHPWEASRLTTGKQKGRIHRLKMLGNGWVPAQAVAAWEVLTS
jgi:hypothetical protein